MTLLGTWAPLILLGALWFFLIRQMQSGGNKPLSFGKSRARLLTKDEVNFTEFMSAIEQNNIRELEVYGMEVRGKHRDSTPFQTTAPTTYFTPELLKSLYDKGVLIKFRQ